MAYLHWWDSEDIIASYEHPVEPGSEEDYFDFDAACNAPAKNPADNLDDLVFHSDHDHFEKVFDGDKTITHNSLAGYTGPDIGVTNIELRVTGQSRIRYHTLRSHSEGTVPRYMVSYNGSRLGNGQIVHSGANYGRVVAPYATNTIIGLKEWVYSGADGRDAPEVDRTYGVKIFRTPVADPSKRFIEISGGVVTSLAHGKIDVTKEMLRRALAGESSFDINLGPTMDVTNGRIKIVSGGNSYTENEYDGNFSGPSFVPVK